MVTGAGNNLYECLDDAADVAAAVLTCNKGFTQTFTRGHEGKDVDPIKVAAAKIHAAEKKGLKLMDSCDAGGSETEAHVVKERHNVCLKRAMDTMSSMCGGKKLTKVEVQRKLRKTRKAKFGKQERLRLKNCKKSGKGRKKCLKTCALKDIQDYYKASLSPYTSLHLIIMKTLYTSTINYTKL